MNKKLNKKKKIRKISPGKLLVLLISLYLVYYSIVFVFNLPIKNIEIIGNKLVSDYEIIMVAKIKNYPPIFKLNSNNVEKALEKIDLIASAKINKNLNGKLTINIKEAKPLFIEKIGNKIILDNNKKISRNDIVGIPILINFVPNVVYDQFILKYSVLKSDIIANINYIEYKPSFTESGEIIDESRFILVMNDGNIVYTNPTKINNLNYYLDILASLENDKYILYLDSGNYDNFVFIPQK